jgi:hypothetical protein
MKNFTKKKKKVWGHCLCSWLVWMGLIHFFLVLSQMLNKKSNVLLMEEDSLKVQLPIAREIWSILKNFRCGRKWNIKVRWRYFRVCVRWEWTWCCELGGRRHWLFPYLINWQFSVHRPSPVYRLWIWRKVYSLA